MLLSATILLLAKYNVQIQFAERHMHTRAQTHTHTHESVTRTTKTERKKKYSQRKMDFSMMTQAIYFNGFYRFVIIYTHIIAVSQLHFIYHQYSILKFELVLCYIYKYILLCTRIHMFANFEYQKRWKKNIYIWMGM